jgi:hypothetical protein
MPIKPKYAPINQNLPHSDLPQRMPNKKAGINPASELNLNLSWPLQARAVQIWNFDFPSWA